MRVKNIVIVNDFNYIQGGASKVAIDTANLLVKNCDDINVYFFSAVQKDTRDLDDKVIDICTKQSESLKDKNKMRGIINGLYNIKAKKELKKLLDSLDINDTIVHFHGWTKALSSSVFDIVFKKKYKNVLTLHDYFSACPNGGYFDYKKNECCKIKPLSLKCIKCNCDSRNYVFKLYRILRQYIQNKIIRLNDKLTNAVAVSDFCENKLKETLNPQINIKKIYNPISFEKEEKIDFIKNKYYLYVGRVSQEKGVDIFCNIISNLGFKGIVVGDGPEKEKLEKKYNTIQFVGWKSKNEVNEYIKHAKALIFPSRLYETAGLTILEANSFNIPAIVNANCAGKEFVDKEFLYNDLEELKKKLIDIESGIIKYKKKSDFKTKYSEEKYLHEILNFYNEI